MADDTDPLDSPSLFDRLKREVIQDRRAASEQYKEIDKDFEFYRGEDGQWEKDDLVALDAARRPHTTFNFIKPSVSAVIGMEVSNRREVSYKPRTTQTGAQQPQMPGQPPAPPIPGANDQGPAELYTAGAQYFRDECDAEDEESDAFMDAAICGMGWTETRIDFEEDPNGKMVVDRCDPGEMGWDCRATKRNMVDSRRFHRARQLDKAAAREMFPDNSLEEIDAKWARSHKLDEPHDREAARNYENDPGQTDETALVTVVEVTWYETKRGYKAVNAESGEVLDVDAADLPKLKKRAAQAKLPVEFKSFNKRVYKQAFLGSDRILGEQEGQECQSQSGFKFQPITGDRDRNRKQWLGIVRQMRDPQRWTNALYSSALWSLMTAGKGIMAERDAFENPSQAEQNWAASENIVWLKTGALSGQNPKVMPKTGAAMPSGIDKMMGFAVGAIRDVSGVNLEMMGATDRAQAASLEYQRRQSATTILAPFFDGLRRYRKVQGRVMLDLIDRYLSDGRLIRIAGPDYEQYVPLIRDPSVREFDIIVEESPTSPNQKEASWAMIQQMLPVMGKNMGPRTTAALLEASPLSTSVVKGFKQAAEQEQQDAANAPPPPEVQLTMAQIEKTKADTQLKAMDIQQRQVETAATIQTTQMDMADRAAQRDHDMRMRGMELQGQSDGEFAKAAGSEMPAKFDQIGQGMMALAQAIAQSTVTQQQTMQQIAALITAPRRTEIQTDASGTPVAAISAVAVQ